MIFLLEYDRATSTLVMITPFDTQKRKQAEDVRLELERNNMNKGIQNEIVILDASSEKELRKTHRRYFEPISQLTFNTHVST